LQAEGELPSLRLRPAHIPSSRHDRYLQSHYCPKDNSVMMRESSRLLARASLVNRDWYAFTYPLLYATVSLPRAIHLDRFARTLDGQPKLGAFTRYLHYFGQDLPADFMRRVFYRLPRLQHFLTQADVTQVEEGDIDPTKPRPKLLTLEVRVPRAI
jgi:hypothetical protein